MGKGEQGNSAVKRRVFLSPLSVQAGDGGDQDMGCGGGSGPVLVTFGRSKLTSSNVCCQRKEKGQGCPQNIQVEMSGWPLDEESRG